jgi:hypothetical protein
MKPKYETLDDYLDELDAIKEKVADNTRGMITRQVIAYFAQSARRVHEVTGQKLRVRPSKRTASTGKR